MSIKTQDIARDGLYGYLAQPEDGGQRRRADRPTIFGVNAVRARLRRDAGARRADRGGVRSLFRRCRCRPITRKRWRARASSTTRSIDDIESRWLDHLQRRTARTRSASSASASAAASRCIRAAQDKRIKACAAAYPSIENPMLANQSQDALKLAREHRAARCISASRASITSRRPRPIARSRMTLLGRTRADHRSSTYPEAEHGFMHRQEPAANPAATAIASPQVVAFLAACLN